MKSPPTSSSPIARLQTSDAIVKAELIKIIFDGSPTTTGSGMVSAIVIATVFGALNEGGHSLTVWCWSAGTILSMWYGKWLAWEAAKVSLARLVRFDTPLIIYGGMTGLAYASTSWLFLPANGTAEAFLIMAVSLVLMGGASI